MISEKTEKTIRAYNNHAGEYTSKFTDFESYKKQITAFHNGFIGKNAHILDLGCGPGNNISIIKNLDSSCTFTGVDLSERFVEMCRSNHPEAVFHHKNICDLKVEDQYDTIIASFCIVHLNHEETGNLVRFIAESLVIEGTLYMSFMEGKTSGFETTSFSSDEIFFNYYSRAEIMDLLASFGIEVESINTEDYLEEDGSTTTDVFLFGVKKSSF